MDVIYGMIVVQLACVDLMTSNKHQIVNIIAYMIATVCSCGLIIEWQSTVGKGLLWNKNECGLHFLHFWEAGQIVNAEKFTLFLNIELHDYVYNYLCGIYVSRTELTLITSY